MFDLVTMFYCSVGGSSHLISFVCTSINSRVWTKVCLNRNCTKRLLSTTMISPNEETLKTKTSEKQDNLLLSKRFVGLEKNIW